MHKLDNQHIKPKDIDLAQKGIAASLAKMLQKTLNPMQIRHLIEHLEKAKP